MLCEREMGAVSLYICHKEKKRLLVKIIAAWWSCCVRDAQQGGKNAEIYL